MCNISTRLNVLNRELEIISKLKKMEEEYDSYSQATCKKCNIYNDFDKHCKCVQRMLSLKEQWGRFNSSIEESILYDTTKKKISCNLKTCKTRKKLDTYKSAQSIEVQAYLKNDAQVSKNASVNITNDVINQALQKTEKQSKSDQVNLNSQFYRVTAQDKLISTFEEKNEQTIPTKDDVHAELHVNNSSINNIQRETAQKQKPQIEEKNTTSELIETDHNVEDISENDKKVIERIQKDLLNEKRRTKDLEKQLKSLTCSINCLKEDSEQRAACLKNALDTAEEQTKVAMDLMKKSKDQADLVKMDKDKLLNEIAKLQQQIIEVEHKNTSLLKEHDHLRNKLQSLSEDESKRCEEVEKEMKRMKYVAQEKEDALSKERAEFINMILELTNVINIQKRRICEVTGICNNQQHSIHEKDQELSQKDTELIEVRSVLQTKNSVFKEMEDKIEHLKYCLCEEKKACNCLKKELETSKENHSSELRIKEKIIEEQNKTISKQRKLLHDSEEMIQQVASEFDEVKDELHKQKEKNESLQVTLDKTDSKLNKPYFSQCEKCRTLTVEIDYLKQEKQRAVTVAKFAYQKLHQSIKEYQRRLVCEKEQNRYMASIIEKQEHEIKCLRKHICENNVRVI